MSSAVELQARVPESSDVFGQLPSGGSRERHAERLFASMQARLAALGFSSLDAFRAAIADQSVLPDQAAAIWALADRLAARLTGGEGVVDWEHLVFEKKIDMGQEIAVVGHTGDLVLVRQIVPHGRKLYAVDVHDSGIIATTDWMKVSADPLGVLADGRVVLKSGQLLEEGIAVWDVYNDEYEAIKEEGMDRKTIAVGNDAVYFLESDMPLGAHPELDIVSIFQEPVKRRKLLSGAYRRAELTHVTRDGHLVLNMRNARRNAPGQDALIVYDPMGQKEVFSVGSHKVRHNVQGILADGTILSLELADNDIRALLIDPSGQTQECWQGAEKQQLSFPSFDAQKIVAVYAMGPTNTLVVWDRQEKRSIWTSLPHQAANLERTYIRGTTVTDEGKVVISYANHLLVYGDGGDL